MVIFLSAPSPAIQASNETGCVNGNLPFLSRDTVHALTNVGTLNRYIYHYALHTILPGPPGATPGFCRNNTP